MRVPRITRGIWLGLASALIGTTLAGCSAFRGPDEPLPEPAADSYNYLVGPGDSLSIFVWRNPELSQTAVVRPDGKITVPLVEDLVVSGKTPTQLAREIEAVLAKYVREPLVTVMVSGFRSVFSEQVRVVGEATEPQALPYRADMSALDLMISVGGLTDFAAGNKAILVRNVDGEQRQTRLRLEDLIKDGDLSANVKLAPGDIIIIPEAFF